MKYHTRFKNFHPKTISAVKYLMREWQSRDQWILMETSCWRLCELYGMPRVDVHKDCTAGDGFYQPSTRTIHMTKPSIITFLHEFRHAMQHLIHKQVDPDIEVDARAWSLSLYFVVAPRTLKRLVREGKVFHTTINDFE